MGDRYSIDVAACPDCKLQYDDVYFAPTCGFTELKCACGRVIDLEEYTGILYEDASNREEIEAAIEEEKRKAGE